VLQSVGQSMSMTRSMSEEWTGLRCLTELQQIHSRLSANVQGLIELKVRLHDGRLHHNERF
jgi:hypothetical protein